MDKREQKRIADECMSRPGNPGAKLHRAIQLQNEMRRQGIDFATMADAFTLMASWNGHTVTVDGAVWVPPLVEAGVVQ